MSGKVIQIHQVMEHEALSIETDFSYLKDTELKAFLSTGESLSNLKTALNRGEKLLLIEKPRAPMFIVDFPKAELSTEDRIKIILHSLTPMQVRQAHPAVNPSYPKDVIKAIDNRLGTAGGVMVGGNPYKSPSSDNLPPPPPMPYRAPEPLVPDPVRPPKKDLVAPTFGVGAKRLIFRLIYDDKEQTKAGNVPYTVIMKDPKGTQITGTLNASGRAEVYPPTTHAAYILFGDEALAADAKKRLPQQREKLNSSLNTLANNTAKHAINATHKQPTPAISKAFAEAVNQKLSQLQQESDTFQAQSFLMQSWDTFKAAQSGATKGVNEYLPDLGEFGQLLDAADINITMLVEAIVTGDIDALEDKFQDWKERGKQGMWEATQTMETLILLLSDSESRALIASLPKRILAALPPDKAVEMSAYHATQLGMDLAVVSGGTALGSLAAGVGAPIACASLILAANARKGGKILEETLEAVKEVADNVKTVRNNHQTPQLYKTDPSIPKGQEDLNTRTFKTKLAEPNKIESAAAVALTDSKSRQEALGKLGLEDTKERLKITDHPDYIDRYHGPDGIGHDGNNKLVELEAKGNNKNTTQVSENVNGDKQGSSNKNRKRGELMQNKKVNQPSNRQGGVYTESEIRLWEGIVQKRGRKRHISTHTNTETGDVRVFERDNEGDITSTLDEFTIDNFNEKREIIDNHFIKKGK